jgi:hypothetical protein
MIASLPSGSGRPSVRTSTDITLCFLQNALPLGEGRELLAARIGDDERGARRGSLSIDEDTRYAAAVDVDARRAFAESAGPSVRLDSLEEKFGQLVLSTRKRMDATRPRSMQPRNGKSRQSGLREV